MFAALYTPPPPITSRERTSLEALLGVARDFSPRVEVHAPDLVTLDVAGLDRLVGPPRTIGVELRQTAADRQIPVHVAIAASRMTALLLSQARPGLTLVAPGDEAAALSSLPLRWLSHAPGGEEAASLIDTLRRWGAKTLGDLAALPSVPLSERLGQSGLVWQRIARGDDIRPLTPTHPDERFEQSLDLDWPIEGLEPLSFVLGRLFDPLAAHLERCDRGVAVLHVRLRLVTRETHERSLQLPAPIRDPRVLRTLALVDLEAHPPPAAIDRVTIEVDPTPGRVIQFSLLARALPSAERLSTLLARLTALMGEDRIGSPRLTDSYRPGAFAIAPFMAHGDPPRPAGDTSSAAGAATGVRRALRRFRMPVPARVSLTEGRPARVASDRRGLAGGVVETCAGPWRTSGEWWRVASTSTCAPRVADVRPAFVPSARRPWNRDEWDVELSDGAAYRIFHDHDRNQWFVDGIID